MKIYTKIVIDIETGKILEAEGFDYEGELALCCGGGDAPEPSRIERRLMREQLGILEQQQEDTALMRPFVLQGMGLIEEDGQIRQMTEDELLAGMSETERSQYELTQMAQERQRRAYAGDLPVSPALEKSLQDQYEQLSEALSQRLGPNWMQTTAGQTAMTRFTQKADLVREEARRGEITGGAGVTLGNLAHMEGVGERTVGMGMSYPGRTTGMMGGYSSILDRMYNERMMQYQADTAQQSGFWSGMGSLAGAGVQAYGTYAGLSALAPAAPVAAASSEILKENIVPVTSPVDVITAIRGVEFDWKNGNGHDVGVVAEEVAKVIPEAVVKIDGVNHVYYHKIIPYLVEAIKEQSAQINDLKGE